MINRKILVPVPGKTGPWMEVRKQHIWIYGPDLENGDMPIWATLTNDEAIHLRDLLCEVFGRPPSAYCSC